MLLVCTGCWEEIRYDPSSAPPPIEPAVQKDAAEEVEIEPITPTADDLFEEDDPKTESQQPDQLPTEQEIAQPDAPLQSVLDSDQERQPSSTDPAPPLDLDWLDDPAPTETEEDPLDDILSATEDREPIAPSRTAVAAWQMSSKWSLAAAYFAKGLGTERYGETLEQANYAARLHDIELPPFPEESDTSSLQTTVVQFLLNEGGARLVDQIGEHLPADHAALAELAIKTHALLLVYTPGNPNLDQLVDAIRAAAENSGLPSEVWAELVDLLDQRDEFAKVKQAVFQLHKLATAHLASTKGG